MQQRAAAATAAAAARGMQEKQEGARASHGPEGAKRQQDPAATTGRSQQEPTGDCPREAGRNLKEPLRNRGELGASC